MNYPSKPWTDGQTFIENGTVYKYDAATNSWQFSPLTYSRIQHSISFSCPAELSSIRVEFSEDQDFSTSAAVYDSTNGSSLINFLVFTDLDGVFKTPVNGRFSSTQFSGLILIPNLDMNTRYFGRYRWTASSGAVGPWNHIIYPNSGGNGSGNNFSTSHGGWWYSGENPPIHFDANTQAIGDMYLVVGENSSKGNIYRAELISGLVSWNLVGNILGPQGNQGFISEVSDYSNETIYQKYDLIYYGGSLYQCKEQNVQAGTLPTNTSYFRLVTKRGEDGESAGFSTPEASIEIVPYDSNPEIFVNASGPDTSKKFNFSFRIPNARDGVDGRFENGVPPFEFTSSDLSNSTLSKTFVELGIVGTNQIPVQIVDNNGVCQEFNNGITLRWTNSGISIEFSDSSVVTGTWKLIFGGGSTLQATTIKNIVANNWVSSDTYQDYPYQCSLSISGVSSDSDVEVVFGLAEAISGDYAPICLSGNGTITIYSKVNTSITIEKVRVF